MCLKGTRQCQVAKCSISSQKYHKFCSVKLDHTRFNNFPVDKPIQRLFSKNLKKKMYIFNYISMTKINFLMLKIISSGTKKKKSR